MRINPNNHALDGGPATSALENEVVADLARMVGYGGPPGPPDQRRHGGQPGSALGGARAAARPRIAYSEQAHYAHARACAPAGRAGHPGGLRRARTPGPRGAGAAPGRGRRGHRGGHARHHRPRARSTRSTRSCPSPRRTARACTPMLPTAASSRCSRGGSRAPSRRRRFAPWTPATASSSTRTSTASSPMAVARCCSRPRRRPRLPARFAGDLFHLRRAAPGGDQPGCSRAGAAAAALWTTLRCLPLAPDDGLGPILGRTRAAALAWAARIADSAHLRLVVEPELDILTFFPTPPAPDRLGGQRGQRARLRGAAARPRGTALPGEAGGGHGLLATATPTWWRTSRRRTVLRSVLMKPEHLAAVDALHAAVERAAATVV